ncbi:MAG: trypsin-like peptidase domain-containing protein [Nitrosopumilus sp.]|nr:trypsin-like peptidase domain-containing protein [Nitrosopumilus sp.]
MANIQRKPPKLIKNARNDLTDDHFRKLVYRRCMKYPDFVKPTPKEKHLDNKLERIVNTNDLLPVSFLEKGYERAKMVGRITTRTSLGTGFLIAPNIIMTNHHVLRNRDEAMNSFIEFNYELDVDGRPKTAEFFALDPNSLFITFAGLDFTIVAVTGNPGNSLGWIPLLRDPLTITRHERIYIVQHPSGRRKEIGIHDNKTSRILEHVFRYTTDTEPGSSGSPCFNRQWELVGIHHSAGTLKNNVYVDNEAIKISSIIRYLDGLVESKNNEAYDVLKFAEGYDTTGGFFGNWGVKTDIRSNWEKVVTDYRGTARFLDLGFWNIEHFNNSAQPERILRVSDVVSRLNLDVMGLVEVTEKPVSAIVKELQNLDRNYGYIIKNVRGSQDLGILYNKDTVDAKEEAWSSDAKKSFDTKVHGKRLFHRHPMKLHIKSKLPLNEEKFDFKMIVLHAKATTHYDEPEIPPIIRKASAESLAAAIEKEMDESKKEGKPELDYIVGGDFNATIQEGSFDVLANKLKMIALTEDDGESKNPDAYTYLMRGKRSLIDHIYISSSAKLHYDPGSISITRIDKEMPQFSKGLSDHAPIAMRLTWDKTSTDLTDPREPVVHNISVPKNVDDIRLHLEK